MKTLLLGAGLVGEPIAIDLAGDPQFTISAADINKDSLEKLKKYNISTIQLDLNDDQKIKKLVKNYDLVVNALPGYMGFRTLKSVIESEKSIIDISFFSENPFTLNDLATNLQVTAIIDCGIAPGLSNMLVGYADNLLERTDKVLIYVGGLPEIRIWPFEYKAVYSPADVIEIYTRPARYKENGEIVTRQALSDREYIYFPGVGSLEAFNSDGLRTLIKTIDAPDMKEKTLRYPKHIEKISLLKESGFFSKDEIEIKGVRISPLEFSSKILFPLWEMREDDKDITVMRVIVEGYKDEEKIRYTYDLCDRYDVSTKTHSMARTTGFTAAVALRMVAKGMIIRKGISALEMVGKDQTCIDFMLKELKMRGININERIEKIE